MRSYGNRSTTSSGRDVFSDCYEHTKPSDSDAFSFLASLLIYAEMHHTILQHLLCVHVDALCSTRVFHRNECMQSATKFAALLTRHRRNIRQDLLS